MKFKIVNPEPEKTNEEQEVEAQLSIDNNGTLVLEVGGWYVFVINTKGVGCLESLIAEDNVEGLQVDKDGKLLLEK